VDALHARVESTAGAGTREADLTEARRAAELTLKHAKAFRAGFPNAARVMGNQRWLQSDQPGAQSWWGKGLAAARTNGARYDEARIQQEIGRRTGDAQVTAGGARIMDEIMASWRAGA